MGISVAWMAVKETSSRDLLGLLGLTASDVVETPNIGLYLIETRGWGVLYGDGSADMGRIDWDQAVELSAEREVLYFGLNETAMASGISCLRGGETAWTVSCVATRGAASAKTSGEVPELVSRVVESEAATDPELGGFAAPELVGEALTGLHYRRAPEGRLLRP